MTNTAAQPEAATDQRSLTERLKQDNWDLHQKAERDSLPAHLAAGTLPKDAYVTMLSQMYLANSALDAAIKNHRASVPALEALIEDRQLQTPYLLEDLAFFGIDPDQLTALPGTADFLAEVETISAEAPLRLLGLHYVREGANNGNRFIAKRVRAAYGLEGADGTRYLDPYGEEQRPLWDAWKVKLDAFGFTPDEQDTVVASARRMFELIMATHNDHDLPSARS